MIEAGREEEAATAALPTPSSRAAQRSTMSKLTLSQLSGLLFRACDDLRGNMDASEYMEYTRGRVCSCDARVSDRQGGTG